jgi:hypothetical protein
MNLQRSWWIAMAFVVLAVTPLAAAGGGDVFGQVGVVSIGDGGGTHALAGGGASGMVGDRVGVFGEFNYIPMGDFGESGEGVNVSSKTLMFGAGVRVYIPGTGKVRLYIPVAGGGLRTTVSASANGSSGSASGNGGYFGAGFGAEIGNKFGVRPELRYSRYQLSFGGVSGGSNVISVAAGIFYRFGGM